MLKAPIQGEGVPAKGVPQGGILSPLLSNVVLNELDWWLPASGELFQPERTTRMTCPATRIFAEQAA